MKKMIEDTSLLRRKQAIDAERRAAAIERKERDRRRSIAAAMSFMAAAPR